MGRAAPRLRERLGEAEDWPERFAILAAEASGWAGSHAGDSARDRDGNLWSSGTYRGEPLPSLE